MTTKEKMLAKYSEVCHRCGQKGHMARECSNSMFKCRLCGGDHRINECPKNGASLQNMIKNRKHEVSEFAKQKMLIEIAEKEKRMNSIKDGGGAAGGWGTVGGGGDATDGAEVGASGGGGAGTAPMCQPVIQVRKKEKTGMPQFKFAPKEKPMPGIKLPAPDLEGDEPAAKKPKTGEAESATGDGGDGDEGGLGGLLGDYGDSSGSEDEEKSVSDGEEEGGKVASFF